MTKWTSWSSVIYPNSLFLIHLRYTVTSQKWHPPEVHRLLLKIAHNYYSEYQITVLYGWFNSFAVNNINVKLYSYQYWTSSIVLLRILSKNHLFSICYWYPIYINTGIQSYSGGWFFCIFAHGFVYTSGGWFKVGSRFTLGAEGRDFPTLIVLTIPGRWQASTDMLNNIWDSIYYKQLDFSTMAYEYKHIDVLISLPFTFRELNTL